MLNKKKIMFFKLTAIGLGCILGYGVILLDNLFIGLTKHYWGYNPQVYVERILDYNPIYGFALTPSSSVSGQNGLQSVTTNAFGYRDHEISLSKSPDEFRVYALGDSVTFGFGIDEQNTFCSVLEKRLNTRSISTKRIAEVVNAGTPSHSPSEYLLRWICDGKHFEPDIVVTTLVINDPMGVYKNNHRNGLTNDEFVHFKQDRSAINPKNRGMLTRSIPVIMSKISLRYAYKYTVEHDRLESEKLATQIKLMKSIPESDLIDEYLLEVSKLIHLISPKPQIYVIAPYQPELWTLLGLEKTPTFAWHNPLMEDYFHEKTIELLDSLNIPYLDGRKLFLEYLADQETPDPKNLFCCGGYDPIHPSESGHALIAQGLEREIIKHFPDFDHRQTPY